MKFFAILTRVHKWAGLFVGLQIILWTAGGLVMSALPLQKVRSEHLIAKPEPQPITAEDVLSPVLAARRAGLEDVTAAQLRRWLGRPVYVLTLARGQKALVDARTAERLSPLSAGLARRVALADYVGRGTISHVALVDKGPVEVRFAGPLWQVRFDRPRGYTVWIDPDDGQVRAHRSALWRIYDFFWMLHIMDYGGRENFNTPWLIAFAASALVFALTGGGLLVHRFALRPRRRKKR